MPSNFLSVEEIYATDTKLKKEDVQTLQNWTEKQHHLPKITDFQIALFLHSCGYSIEAAKVTIDNFFTVKTVFPELHATPSVEILKRQLEVSYANTLPHKTKQGYNVIWFALRNTAPELYTFVNQLNYTCLKMLLEVHQNGPPEGIVYVFDAKGFSMAHLAKINLLALKKFMYFVQEAAPIRIKGLHHINIGPVLEKVLILVKPFMKKELIQMLHFHARLDSLHEFVPKDITPKDYGGNGPSMEEMHEKVSENLLENMDFFKWMESLVVDEKCRAGKAKNAGDVFGVEGSFKKLELD